MCWSATSVIVAAIGVDVWTAMESLIISSAAVRLFKSFPASRAVVNRSTGIRT